MSKPRLLRSTSHPRSRTDDGGRRVRPDRHAAPAGTDAARRRAERSTSVAARRPRLRAADRRVAVEASAPTWPSATTCSRPSSVGTHDQADPDLRRRARIGSTYALFALGISLIFGVMHLVNFAHGELLTLSAYTTYFVFMIGGNWWIAVPVADPRRRRRLGRHRTTGLPLGAELQSLHPAPHVVRPGTPLARVLADRRVPQGPHLGQVSWAFNTVEIGPVRLEVGPGHRRRHRPGAARHRLRLPSHSVRFRHRRPRRRRGLRRRPADGREGPTA